MDFRNVFENKKNYYCCYQIIIRDSFISQIEHRVTWNIFEKLTKVGRIDTNTTGGTQQGETILSSVSNLTRLDFSVDSLKFLEKIGNETRSIRRNGGFCRGKKVCRANSGRKRSIHCIIWKRLM